MYVDAQTRLWASVALTTTAVSTNAYDTHAPYTLNAASNRIGTGEPLVLAIAIEVAGAHAGTETYEFQLISATATDLTTGQIVEATTGTIATADVAATLPAGALIYLDVPIGRTTQRYVGAKIVSANSAAVTVSAWITEKAMVDSTRPYSTAITVA